MTDPDEDKEVWITDPRYPDIVPDDYKAQLFALIKGQWVKQIVLEQSEITGSDLNLPAA